MRQPARDLRVSGHTGEGAFTSGRTADNFDGVYGPLSHTIFGENAATTFVHRSTNLCRPTAEQLEADR